jgi:glycosyltransferase involved in cell wall biosynthesis
MGVAVFPAELNVKGLVLNDRFGWSMTRSQKQTNASLIPVIALAPNDWDGPWRNRQYMLTRLAQRGWPIIYSTGPLSWWQRESLSWSKAPRVGRFEEKEGVSVNIAGRFPFRWPSCHAWDHWVISNHARKLVRRLFTPDNLLVCLFHPSLWRIAECLQPRWLVYYAYDNFRRESDGDRRLLAAERAVVDCASLIVVTTRSIGDALGTAAQPKLRILGNGVDFHRVVSAADQPCPDEIAAIPRPRIGYCGAINRKLDFALVERIALLRPDWHWVFIGPEMGLENAYEAQNKVIREAWQHTKRLPNVYFAGEMASASFSTCLHHMDVNIICNRVDDGWWKDSYPLKFHEYLACGRPVVSSPVESLLEFAAVAEFVDGVEPWMRALERAIYEGGVGTAAERRAIARQNDWDIRVELFEHWLKEIVTTQ